MCNYIDVDFIFNVRSEMQDSFRPPGDPLIKYRNEVYTPREIMSHSEDILLNERYFKIGIADESYDNVSKARSSVESKGAKTVSMKCYGHISDGYLYYNIDNNQKGEE